MKKIEGKLQHKSIKKKFMTKFWITLENADVTLIINNFVHHKTSFSIRYPSSLTSASWIKDELSLFSGPALMWNNEKQNLHELSSCETRYMVWRVQWEKFKIRSWLIQTWKGKMKESKKCQRLTGIITHREKYLSCLTLFLLSNCVKQSDSEEFSSH